MTESTDNFEEIDGVGPTAAENLADEGYRTFEQLAGARASDLAENVNRVGEGTAEDIVREAQQMTGTDGFQEADELYESIKDRFHIAFMPKVGYADGEMSEWDDIMRGGVEEENITEIFGEYGAGKSQITQQLCVNAQLSEEYGGVNGSVAFIDTEDTFRPARIEDIVRGLPDEILRDEMEKRGIEGTPDDAEAMNELVQSFLNNIAHAKAGTSEHQMKLVDNDLEDMILDTRVDEDMLDMKLIVVDSLIAHFRAEYIGRGELAKRQQKLNEHLEKLDSIADDLGCAVVLTNQVSADPDSFFGGGPDAVGGNIMAHRSRYRILVKKNQDESRVLYLENAPHIDQIECPIEVTGDGVKEA